MVTTVAGGEDGRRRIFWHPRFAYYGRLVALGGPDHETFGMITCPCKAAGGGRVLLFSEDGSGWAISQVKWRRRIAWKFIKPLSLPSDLFGERNRPTNCVIFLLTDGGRPRRALTCCSGSRRVSVLAGPDRIVVLSEGLIAEEGTDIELLASGGAYARLWERQAAL